MIQYSCLEAKRLKKRHFRMHISITQPPLTYKKMQPKWTERNELLCNVAKEKISKQVF
jgi:hypothetical protein